MPSAQVPQQVLIHRSSRTLELVFSDQRFSLPAELLRVYSPSAEVQGHGKPILQIGKRQVNLVSAECIGHYGLKIGFDDGHASGIFNWAFLQTLHQQQDVYWQNYLQQLQQANASRDADTQIVQLQPAVPIQPAAPK
jgi:hypothetical protein